jgi:N-acetylneuraminate synthase
LGGEYAPLELLVLKEAFVNNESLQEDFSTATAPLVIAELSGNHNQSLERALDLVDAAGAAGAGALKLQTYTADTMTLDIRAAGFVIEDQESPWFGRSLYDLYAEAHTPWEWHEPLFERAHSLGMLAFSTPFDESAVDFLESLDVPCYKIASFELTDIPLIESVAQTGKPILISTGMGTLQEIADAVGAVRQTSESEVVLLKCTSSYPAPVEAANLATIPDLRQQFGCEVGLSDHTPGVTTAIASVALGAVVVEKHLTLSRADGGVDSSFSMEPAEFAQLVTGVSDAWKALGDVSYGAGEAETAALQFRRSIYVVADLAAGDVLNAENIRAIRPGAGLPPSHMSEVTGRRVNCPVPRGTPLTWDIIGA